MGLQSITSRQFPQPLLNSFHVLDTELDVGLGGLGEMASLEVVMANYSENTRLSGLLLGPSDTRAGPDTWS